MVLKVSNVTVTFQCAWRQRVASRELRKFKMAARETGALKEAKDKLEKRVEELTWHLPLKKRLRLQIEEAKYILLRNVKLHGRLLKRLHQLSRKLLSLSKILKD